ncbi:MAG: hypothetical protein QGG40_13655, partial [Myxococcota bacterium]|nr:hypothetical protein [Myxococcota bacterium]
VRVEVPIHVTRSTEAMLKRIGTALGAGKLRRSYPQIIAAHWAVGNYPREPYSEEGHENL